MGDRDSGSPPVLPTPHTQSGAWVKLETFIPHFSARQALFEVLPYTLGGESRPVMIYPPNYSSPPAGLVQPAVLARQHAPSSALLAGDRQAHRLLANLPFAPRHAGGSRPRGGGPLAPG